MTGPYMLSQIQGCCQIKGHKSRLGENRKEQIKGCELFSTDDTSSILRVLVTIQRRGGWGRGRCGAAGRPLWQVMVLHAHPLCLLIILLAPGRENRTGVFICFYFTPPYPCCDRKIPISLHWTSFMAVRVRIHLKHHFTWE